MTEDTGVGAEEDKSIPELYNRPPTAKTVAKMTSHINVRQFQAAHLKTFSNALFDGETMWICGWNMNIMEHKDIVLLHVQVLEYKILSKQKKLDQKAELPLIMCPFKKFTLCKTRR